MNQAKSDLNELTSTIADAPNKPHLKLTLEPAMKSFGHNAFDINEAFSEFFTPAVVH